VYNIPGSRNVNIMCIIYVNILHICVAQSDVVEISRKKTQELQYDEDDEEVLDLQGITSDSMYNIIGLVAIVI
jgi:hypothetical protein